MEYAGHCLIKFCVILMFIEDISCEEGFSTPLSILQAKFNNCATHLRPHDASRKDLQRPSFGESRASGKHQSDNILSRVIPMLATPFLIQTTFLPMVLLGMKFLLIQSIFLGKLAIIFGLVNLLRSRLEDQQGQLYSHNIHVGYS